MLNLKKMNHKIQTSKTPENNSGPSAILCINFIFFVETGQTTRFN